MSESTPPTTYSSEGEEDRRKKERKPDDRAKAQVEPIPRHLEFFAWLEQLFYEPPDLTNFPDKIDVTPVAGANLERLLKPIWHRVWPAGSVKPPRSKLVEFSNEILFKCQQETDVKRRRAVYSVNAWHFALNPDPYNRYLLVMQPGEAYAFINGQSPIEEDDPRAKFSSQVLSHHEQMFQLYGTSYSGFIDRYDRDKERDAAEIERLRRENRDLREQLERSLSFQLERDERREWMKFKVKTADRAAEIGFGLMPSLLGRLLPQQGTGESGDSIALKPFFKPAEEGGVLAADQSDLLFGEYDRNANDPQTGEPLCRRPGILTFKQAKLLFDVAQCRVPADELDKLLPDGPFGISPDQYMKLQASGLGMKIAPLFAVFEPRYQRWAARRGGGGGSTNGAPSE